MASRSNKVKQGSNILVHGVEWKALDFNLTPAIVETLDASRAQSQLPSKALLINDIHTHFKCAIQESGTIEMDEALG